MRRLLSVVALVTLGACASPTAPRETSELACANAVVAPDRYAVPHRWADTTWLFFGPNDRNAGKPLGVIVRPFVDGHCITLADSIWLKAP